MPRTQTILRVFISSPTDVTEERAILESVIRELNYTWSGTLGIRLEPVMWETDTYPGVGTDAQAVINEQIGDDYDIFIGIMWKRFGTPTGRGGSGTAEEFDRAYQRFRQNPDQIRIMFYFKDAPVAVTEMDPAQLTSINEFRERVRSQGQYDWTYTDTEEFATLVRMHLGYQVQQWRTGWGTRAEPETRTVDDTAYTEAVSNAQQTIRVDEGEEEGFLDLIELGEQSFETLLEATSRITSAVESIGNRMNERTEEVNQALASQGEVDRRTVRRIANRSAQDMEQFVARMEPEIPIFSEAYSRAIDTFARASVLQSTDFENGDEQSVREAIETVRNFRSMQQGSLNEMRGLRETIASLPRITTTFNRAKRRTLATLDALDGEMTSAIRITSEVQTRLEQVLSEPDNG